MAVNTIYNPIGFIDHLSTEMNRLFDLDQNTDVDGVVNWRPAVDIIGNEESYILRADLPGVDPEQVDIEVEAGVLRITGERDNVREEGDQNFQRYERHSGKFSRRFTLPDAVDVDKISAKTVNGVLEIIIPKQPKLAPKKIKIKTK